MQSSTLFNANELSFSRNLYADHREAATILDATIEILARWVAEFYQAEPALAQPLAEQPNLADDAVCAVTFTLLLGESVERLICARLLLHTGHQSRAIASCRDSLEALQAAHVSRVLPARARRWLSGKKIVAPKDLIMPPYVSNQLRDATAQLFNVLGTHAYRDAVYLSLLSTTEGQPAAVKEKINYIVAENLGRVLATCGLTTAYCLDQFPKLQTRQVLTVIDGVENITANLLGLKINLRDPMLSGYQASF